MAESPTPRIVPPWTTDEATLSATKAVAASMAIEQPDCGSIQIIFNLLRPRPAESFLAAAKGKNVGTLIVRWKCFFLPVLAKI